ncbi:hypothetical protein BXQ17_01000 [Polaribacter sp. BM10]|uniref:DUF262 domain-containing protein n=1 Tax=Polaribacter sp. BM10 TaxID=1529069 RepID=UPI00098BCA83|nr:DUF262 domain-containing protein [Polaribacter sp. BM10]AQS92728.1 hypothetical protein BXQ17_01000 [Polaribacter sp. BM10]
MSNKIELKPINSILGERFYIPSYQRGYRWTSEQVEALLNDLWEFKTSQKTSDSDAKNPFYCLQPIAIKEYNEDDINYWEVIDGQQRLTTILILLYYFNETEFKTPKKIFNIKYETRSDSENFLENIKDDTVANQNIDYFHINDAFKTIVKWFQEKEETNAAINSEFYPVLINQTKLIWFEITDNQDSIDIFTRLNMGKIPLTNAELVKALFLRETNFNKKEDVNLKQLQIASEWDAIESTLQNDDFWYFIYNNSNPLKYETRIEYIFDLIKNKTKEDEDRFTFYKFSEAFTTTLNEDNNPDIDKLWMEIKKYFLTFQEWFKDRELYHLIGFLISTNSNVRLLKEASADKTKTAFKLHLKKKIKAKVKCQIDDLSYGDKLIKTVLLLFNIQTILENPKSNMRFPFNSYENENWDIEHLRSQTDKTISGKQRVLWSKDILEYLTGKESIVEQRLIIEQELKGKVKKISKGLLSLIEAEKVDAAEFEKLYKKVAKLFKEDKEPDNSISNLALLDASTNRSYKNAMFPIKRKTIIENDKKGTFVPICTRNVFLKSYSKKLDDVMYWKNSDANDYLEAIKNTLKQYLPTQNAQDGQQ